MAQPTIQCSFNSGEWAPTLFARVDLEKYKSGAALLRNFFVDYRGGASTRTGTKYILRSLNGANPPRLIPFQASFNIGYVLEFGNGYIRFYNNGAPVLEDGLAITGITQANPAVISVVNTYAVNDWVYVTGVNGMTQVNGHYYIVTAATGGTITISDLFGVPVDSTGFGAWTSGGITQRVYTLPSPYSTGDLAKIKFALNVDTMILCHPSVIPYSLTVVAPTNWVLLPIVFGTTILPPNPISVAQATSVAPITNNTHYAYVVTSVDSIGQESAVTPTFVFANVANIAAQFGTNTITWAAATGAISYNIYKAVATSVNPVPVGVSFGFVGNVTGLSFADTNITPDFSQGPPIIRNPFIGSTGSTIANVIMTNEGSYTIRPTVVFGAPPVGATAYGVTVLHVITQTIVAPGTGYVVNDTLTFVGNLVLRVATVGGGGTITSVTRVNSGVYQSALPALPLAPIATSGVGINATFNLTWGVFAIDIIDHGDGYLTPPTVTFSAGAAAGTAVLGPPSVGNPSVPAFFQQRLILAATSANPQTIYMSQTAAYYNFNVSNPAQEDDAITATLISGQLNNIKSMLPQPSGLVTLSDGGSWLINGGSFGSAVTPATTVANTQSFIGTNDVPPIIVNYDILYVQAKGSSIRDASYNFYSNVFTGEDVSIISSHLFYGFQILEWAFAEEPYKVVWAIRDDGTLLSFTFIKEQDFKAWAHHDTLGQFKSVATVIENIGTGFVNALYVVVQRLIEGQTVQYIERMAERSFPNGVQDAWCVDSGLQYVGTPATTFTGGEHLGGETVTGLADGIIIPPFVMPLDGAFTLALAASTVTVGFAFTAQLQTLQIDLGEPTVQGKEKKISAVTARVAETLGLFVGSDFTHLVTMKDLVRGNVGSMTNTVVTDLVSGDAQTIIDTKWAPQGQYCFQQTDPYPATILGAMPEVSVGDTK